MLLETAAVGVTAPAEQMAAASLVGHDEAPMTHGASAARGDALDAVQSVPLPAGGSVSRELQERDVSRDTEAKEVLAKRVRAVIESGDQNLLFAFDSGNDFCGTLLHMAAAYGLVESVQQLMKAGCKKLLFACRPLWAVYALPRLGGSSCGGNAAAH